jgi:hypothetical protein
MSEENIKKEVRKMLPDKSDYDSYRELVDALYQLTPDIGGITNIYAPSKVKYWMVR